MGFGVIPLFVLAFLAIAVLSFLLFVTMTTAVALRRIRQRRGMTVLRYVEQAVRLNLPLPRALLAATHAEYGRTRDRLARLSTLVEEGDLLGDALAQASPEISRRALQLTVAAERSGRLGDTLRRLVEQDRRFADDAESGAGFTATYFVAAAVAASAAVAFVGIYVMPMYEKIFADFGIPLPEITMRTLGLGRYLSPLILLAAACAAFAFAGLALWEIFTRIEPRDEWGVGGPLDRLWWALPVSGGLVRARGLADACHVLGESLRAGVPLDAALSEASYLRINQVLRERLRRWSAGVADGGSAADAAREARLPRLVVGMLAAAPPHALADTFDFLSRYYDTRFSRAMAFLRALPAPAMAVVMGVLVGAIVIGLFLPLVRVIESVTLQVWAP